MIGHGASAQNHDSTLTATLAGIAIGTGATCETTNAIALGTFSQANRDGELNIGGSGNGGGWGYNHTSYRLIGGVHDGQDAHDAVTVEQVNATIDAINTALSTNIPHIGAQS